MFVPRPSTHAGGSSATPLWQCNQLTERGADDLRRVLQSTRPPPLERSHSVAAKRHAVEEERKNVHRKFKTPEPLLKVVTSGEKAEKLRQLSTRDNTWWGNAVTEEEAKLVLAASRDKLREEMKGIRQGKGRYLKMTESWNRHLREERRKREEMLRRRGLELRDGEWIPVREDPHLKKLRIKATKNKKKEETARPTTQGGSLGTGLKNGSPVEKKALAFADTAKGYNAGPAKSFDAVGAIGASSAPSTSVADLTSHLGGSSESRLAFPYSSVLRNSTVGVHAGVRYETPSTLLRDIGAGLLSYPHPLGAPAWYKRRIVKHAPRTVETDRSMGDAFSPELTDAAM